MKNSDYKATGSISQQVISDHEKSVSASVFVSSHLCEFISSLCSVVFLYPSFLSFSCVLSRFCLVFGFCRFLIIPLPCSFGILLTIYEVQWNNDVNTHVDFFTLTTSCEAPHYSSITQTHINYRIYKPKARLVN